MTIEELRTYVQNKNTVETKVSIVAEQLHRKSSTTYPLAEHITHWNIDPFTMRVTVYSADEHPIMGEYLTCSFSFPGEYLCMSFAEIEAIDNQRVT